MHGLGLGAFGDVGSYTRAPIQGGEMRFLAPLSGGPMHEGFSG